MKNKTRKLSDEEILEFLLIKYADEWRNLQVKLNEAKKRCTSVSETIELLRKNGNKKTL